MRDKDISRDVDIGNLAGFINGRKRWNSLIRFHSAILNYSNEYSWRKQWINKIVYVYAIALSYKRARARQCYSARRVYIFLGYYTLYRFYK